MARRGGLHPPGVYVCICVWVCESHRRLRVCVCVCAGLPFGGVFKKTSANLRPRPGEDCKVRASGVNYNLSCVV